jgi:RHS repeat-associated protein
VLRKYVHGPGVDEPIVWYEGTGTTAKNWLYTDHLGSVVATANSAGASTATYTYGPYGEPNVATGLRFRYTGQQLIAGLDLYYYKARFYSPKLGRFLQTDPIGYKDDQNLYACVANNSPNRVDPFGLANTLVGQWGRYPGGIYADTTPGSYGSVQAAGSAAISSANPTSISSNTEQCNWICRAQREVLITSRQRIIFRGKLIP